MKMPSFEELKRHRKAVFFVLKLIGVYFLLQSLYDFVLSPHTTIDDWLIDSIIRGGNGILEILGFTLLPSNSMYEHHMGIIGTPGVIIGNPCDGLSLFILYTSFLIVFKGKWWFKSLFISFGILLIHFLNVMRVVSLALIVKFYPSTLDFHHSYTFTLFVYAFIFLLWMLRIKVYQKKKI